MLPLPPWCRLPAARSSPAQKAEEQLHRGSCISWKQKRVIQAGRSAASWDLGGTGAIVGGRCLQLEDEAVMS